MFPFSCNGTLHTVTLICLFSLYWRWKCFVGTLLPASRTSHVAKLHQQKCRHWIPVNFKSSSNVSFFNPANLLVLRFVMIKDRVFGSMATTSLVWVVFDSPKSTDRTFWLCPFCDGGIELARSEVSFVLYEASSNGHSNADVEVPTTSSSGFLGRASRPFFGVNRSFCVLLEATRKRRVWCWKNCWCMNWRKIVLEKEKEWTYWLWKQ